MLSKRLSFQTVILCSLFSTLYNTTSVACGNTPPPSARTTPRGPSPKPSANITRKGSEHFESIEALKAALRAARVETTNIMVGVDFTGSNEESGEYSFAVMTNNPACKNLHWLDSTGATLNPYQWALTIVGRTLERLDDDKKIPAFGFGDVSTKNLSVFSLKPNASHNPIEDVNPTYYQQDRTLGYSEPIVPCLGFGQVFTYYAQAAKNVNKSGPTSFVPFIHKAIEYSRMNPRQHITAIILTDGDVTNLSMNQQALIEASSFPISFIVVGLGDGPFGAMEAADDFEGRRFDNLQFVNFFATMNAAGRDTQAQEDAFAKKALGELPKQMIEMRKLNLLD